MSYTLSLLKSGIAYFVPYADKHPLMKSDTTTKTNLFSKRSERARLATAKMIENDPNATERFIKSAKKMRCNVKQSRAERNYQQKKYSQDQVTKSTTLLAPIPLASPIVTGFSILKRFKAASDYAIECSTTGIKSLKKFQDVAIPVLSAVALPFVAPYITPYITAEVTAVSVGLVFSTTYIVDTVTA
ncbi:MAG: hypothetical protein H0X51_01425 [Parachlamydiaceae bacterium]|nr:hypothetical protein [Parachlamydiaceae bacterium]